MVKVIQALLCTCFCVVSSITGAQDIRSAEDSICANLSLIANSTSDLIRGEASERCKDIFRSILDFGTCFDYPFDSLKEMCTLHSPDRAFRIYNWNVPANDQTHTYECFVQFPPGEDGKSSWIELQSPKRMPEKLTAKQFGPEEWPGCLYYAIIPPLSKKLSGQYTLLAWDGNDRLTNRKIVDVLTIDRGKLRFGAAMFKVDNSLQKRMVFEYSDEAVMSLRYHERDRRIVFDHLAPRVAGMEGHFAFYGPDLTFDALEWSKNSWKLLRDVDVRLERGEESRPYSHPRRSDR